MGLDMYLTGEKFLKQDYAHPENNPKEDGFDLRSRTLKLGYWRKHPNLHGFIVNNFANVEDECQEIPLGVEDIETIIKAVEDELLPVTEGFFFGVSASTPEQYAEKYGFTLEEAIKEKADEKAHDLKTWNDALNWLETEDESCYRSVSYRASW